MPDRLPGKSLITAVVRSPLGALLQTKAFEIKKLKVTMQKELPLGRLGAAADVAGTDVDRFVREAGIAELTEPERPRVARALARHQALVEARQAADQRWEEAFFGPTPPAMHERVTLEVARRKASTNWVHGGKELAFLSGRGAYFRWEIPTADAVRQAWSGRLAEPARAYAADDPQPAVSVSHPVAGPAGSEYWARFPSPAMGDTVWAHVYEPDTIAPDAPTVIISHGVTLAGDLDYWSPEEAIFARPLAARGLRTLVVTSPWHGRRTPTGWYGGEPYLARSPLGQMELFTAQTREVAILIEWARSLGSRSVGVAGVSLGGIISHLAAGWCATWPARRRPDFAWLGATCTRIDQVVLYSQMATLWGVPEQLARAGWTEAHMQAIRPILDPPARPGLPPDQILAMVGRQDEIMSYRYGKELLQQWGVPACNITELPGGHSSVLMMPLRDPHLLDPLVALANRRMTAAA